MYLLVTVIIQLNILIAIVSDSYDAARASGKALYYRAHLSLVSETAEIASRCIPRRLLPAVDGGLDPRRASSPRFRSRTKTGGASWKSRGRTRAAVEADTRLQQPLHRNNAQGLGGGAAPPRSEAVPDP